MRSTVFIKFIPLLVENENTSITLGLGISPQVGNHTLKGKTTIQPRYEGADLTYLA